MKNIVICCDGTGCEYGENLTNVIHTYDLAEKGAYQIAWYDSGIGTGGWAYNEQTGGLKALSDQATGMGLQKNVDDAYRFLMSVWEPGDKIFLFGFSRGAFTVRSLAGILWKVGLLPRHWGAHVEYASKLYNTEGNDTVALGFKETFCHTCPVHFIGVWDTVASLTMNAGKKWSNAYLTPETSNAFQALAIDEQRADFPPSLWYEANVRDHQTVDQVWFMGSHADVGGWFPDRRASDIPLAWMLRKAIGEGLKVHMGKLDAITRLGVDGMLTESYTGFWKFRGRSVRTIPAGSNVHSSVVQRKLTHGYAPKNLPETFEVVD